MLVGSDSEFVVEAVMPYFFHVVPVVDDAVLDGEAELEDTLLGLSLRPIVLGRRPTLAAPGRRCLRAPS